MIADFDFSARAPTFAEKLWNINWGLVLLLSAIASIGFAVLYSAANGNLDPWAMRQMIRFAASVALLLCVAVVDVQIWLKLAYPIYGVALLLLVAVDLHGAIGMGAQRWIELGPVSLQPSEIMKIGLVMALARYFNGLTIEEVGRPLLLLIPMGLVFVPAALVLKQPDLGTAMMLIMCGGGMFFLAGVRLWKFIIGIVGGVSLVPIAWGFLREYQKRRINTFLNPETDSLGAGYHILQSKIALGSGGMFGKGFLLGTQSHLNFLPEKQTDFIFTMFAEEFGLVGGLILLGLYSLVFAYGFAIALRSRNHFGRLLALGITVNFFLYVFINTAMVMGLIPVVGVPLPLISYGGTAMLTVMFGFGLLISVYIHRDSRINRRGETQT
ncbi:MAG TPA: rod shape-determining protein RodA [Stellaceae bacterium]|nr:rod shape-determining protein RodA [Stellaceae bacterium]